MENNNAIDTNMETVSKGLVRPCKLFVKVDKDGMLTDTLAISDVVNLDCYESIVSSVRRIVSMFIGSKPDNVIIDAVFYYKKRARSTRMNPAKIYTTTDCFRAIAEHPYGEIPLGAEWHRKEKDVTLTKKVKRDLSKKSATASSILLSSSSEVKSNSDEIPNKRQKLEQLQYKTFMPVSSTADSKVGFLASIQPLTSGMQSQKSGSSMSSVPNARNVQPLVFPVSQVTRDKVSSTEDASKKSNYTSKHPQNNEYQWPEKTECEVILNYDGVTERRRLPPRVSVVVKAIMKGNYSYLRPDIVSALIDDQNPSDQKYYSDFPGDVTSNLNNQFTKTDKTLIKSVRHAKAEIFKVLSLLSLTKARFKELMDWMKMLKLEETKSGKFYLSERNPIDGKGPLKITYDSNEQSVARLNQIHRLRGERYKAKHLHPVSVDASPSVDQVMFLMPAATGLENSASDAKGNNAPYGYFVSVPSVQGNNKEKGKTSQSETRSSEDPCSNGSILVPIQQQKVANSCNVAKSDKSIKDSKATKARLPPNILRPRTRTCSKNVPTVNEVPTPMHLYRTYETEQDLPCIKVEAFDNSDNNAVPDFRDSCIKLEPVDYNSDATEDYNNEFDRAQSPSVRLSTNSHTDMHKALISDATMPHTNEIHGSPMELVIKEEPVDDFEESMNPT